MGTFKNLKIKRVYDSFDERDGFRILVDRLWPRGLSKNKAKIDMWLKDIAPSNELRKWFGHKQDKWIEFMDRYFVELNKKRELVELIADKMEKGIVTLIYGAKDERYNNAAVLKEYIEKGRL